MQYGARRPVLNENTQRLKQVKEQKFAHIARR